MALVWRWDSAHQRSWAVSMKSASPDLVEGERGRRRRFWSEEEKRRIVAESEEPGASASVVAQRHGLNANLLFTWRRQLRDPPKLLPGEGVTLIPVTVASEPSASRGGSSRRCAGAMRGASSSSWPTSPPTRAAARARRSRLSRWKRSNASMRSSRSSATSTARAPKSGCACGARSRRLSSPPWSCGCVPSAPSSLVAPPSPRPSITC